MNQVSVVDALLPVLVAELADSDAREAIEQLAKEGRICLVPVIDPPVDTSMHVLEVHTPGQTAPLVVLAEPAGPPNERGFPLRLHTYGSTATAKGSATSPPPSNERLPSVRATRPRPATLSRRHTQDLLGDAIRGEEDSAAEAAALVGRDVAGG